VPESALAMVKGPVPRPVPSSSALLSAAGVMRMFDISELSETTGFFVVSVKVVSSTLVKVGCSGNCDAT
jgi:hypothetical protein